MLQGLALFCVSLVATRAWRGLGKCCIVASGPCHPRPLPAVLGELISPFQYASLLEAARAHLQADSPCAGRKVYRVEMPVSFVRGSTVPSAASKSRVKHWVVRLESCEPHAVGTGWDSYLVVHTNMSTAWLVLLPQAASSQPSSSRKGQTCSETQEVASIFSQALPRASAARHLHPHLRRCESRVVRSYAKHRFTDGTNADQLTVLASCSNR